VRRIGACHHSLDEREDEVQGACFTINVLLTCHSRLPPEGVKRADGASKGRVTQVKNGHLRSTTVTQKWGLSRENAPDQHFRLKSQGGSIPPSSTAPSKRALTGSLVGVRQGRRIPPSYPQVCDQEKCVRSGRGNLGLAPPSNKSGTEKPQVDRGFLQTALD
jgi:hypothetical protein